MKFANYLLAIVTASATSLVIAFGIQQPTTPAGNHMKQSTTYLHLLKKTPFFTSLDKSQLKWVIAHSTEWEAQAGMQISDKAQADAYVWILLDGGWQIEQKGAVLKAGHADPAKWYGGKGAGLLPADSRLVANQHSYVMRIARTDFDAMLANNFNFTEHLREGEAFYRAH